MITTQAQMRKYGTTADAEKRESITSLNCGSILSCILLPMLVFISVSYIRSSDLRYDNGADAPALSLIISLLILVAVFSLCVPIWSSTNKTQGRILTFYFLSCLLAWVVGFISADFNYHTYTKPYLDMTNLNTYPHVNPSVYYSQQFMDAAVLEFVPQSHIDVSKSYGFKNGNVYCVAPIVGPDAPSKEAGIGKKDYDFWAVGINCCSAHRANFHCGEYSNPKANKGLRLMRQDYKNYFRLAVQGAAASYNIKANQPMFMYWMEHPSDEIHAYMTDGSKYFLHGVLGYLALQSLMTVIAVFRFLK